MISSSLNGGGRHGHQHTDSKDGISRPPAPSLILWLRLRCVLRALRPFSAGGGGGFGGYSPPVSGASTLRASSGHTLLMDATIWSNSSLVRSRPAGFR